ncbi:cellulase family glycosylhydrolase [Cellvibrio sp. KY-GH-1]|uniref:glycoside hydrolase 5 family protein n=1 Tax=Cellvibrio sp. KY-GH-1 TaxID=2303332 RepID=UPI001CD94EA1|nr:cellulase family glycosylhydrolase [Cellvibrio sp. KY-GH-1]
MKTISYFKTARYMGIWAAILSFGLSSVALAAEPKKADAYQAFVKVKGTQFEKSGKPYYIAGTNMWYAGYLGAANKVGNRARLAKELDTLKALGVNNLRVLAVSEKSDINSVVKPATTNGFGNYDEELLKGLDYFMAEVAKRDMTVVLYLNNYWQWSGGMSQYMSWVDGKPMQDPNVTKDWEGFMARSASFYQSTKAQDEYRKTIKKIVTRVNTVTGKTYADDAAILSWQLANEPRPGNSNATDKEKQIYVDWINGVTSYIKELDPHHLVSTGSEGLMGSVRDEKLFIDAHTSKNVDYLTYHMWIRNWGWIDKTNFAGTWDAGWAKGEEYLTSHIAIAKKIGKPIVLEEFGLDRDAGAYDIKATTQVRDKFYQQVFNVLWTPMKKGEPIAGYNFWAWNGAARTSRPNYWWQEGDDYMGDPPQEEQGMYGIFDSDASTIAIIKAFNAKIHSLNK